MPVVEPRSDPKLQAVVAEINGAWPRVAAVWEALQSRYGLHMRADTGLNDQVGFLLQGLAVLVHMNLLRSFAYELIKGGLVTDDFVRRVEDVVGEGQQAALQRYQNNGFRSVSALLTSRKIMQACEQVCRIDIDGHHAGTGVLIEPRLVATAAHVIAHLVDHKTGRAKTGSLARLTVHFGYYEDYADPQNRAGRPVIKDARPARLEEDWLARVSLPTENEASDAAFTIGNINGIALPEGPWDLALLNLTAPPREDLAGLRRHPLPPSAVTGRGVHILHHPNGGLQSGMPLLWSTGKVTEALGEQGRDPVRLLHDANTAGGSSGAPCFNDDWEIIGIHQAGQRRAAPAGQIIPSGPNRLVPVFHWLDASSPPLRASRPYLVELDGAPPHPVLGRRDTQDRIWRAMQAGAARTERTFIVRGEAGTGKSFTTQLVKASVKKRGDLVVELDVRNFQGDDARSFAEAIATAFGLTPPAHDDAPGEHLTTPARDVRNDTIPELTSTLGILEDRMEHYWVVLDGFQTAKLASPSGIPQVVSELMSRLDIMPGFRLVLLGWNAAVGAALTPAVENLAGPDVAGAMNYLTGRYFPDGETYKSIHDAQRQKTIAIMQKRVELEFDMIDLTAADAFDAVLVELMNIRADLDRVYNRIIGAA